MLTALTIHLFHVEKCFLPFLRVSQRDFWPKRFLCQLAFFSAIQKVFSSWFTNLFFSFWDRTPARATAEHVGLRTVAPTKLRQTCFCAGSLGGAPNHTHFTNSKTKFLFKDIEVLYTTSFTATSISMLHMYSQTAVRLRLTRSLRCCCSKP